MLDKKRIGILSIAMLCFTHFAYAKTVICPFKDYFSIYATNGTQILLAEADKEGHIKYTQSSPTFFILSCGDNNSTKSGDVKVTVGKDFFYQCTLTIHDGPYEMDPSVKISHCTGGLNYTGMDHVFGSYTYTLKFS